MRGVFQGPFASGEKMDGIGVAVLAIDLGVPAAQGFIAHQDAVIQTDAACFGTRVMVTGFHHRPSF
jgi:hypothetical protein